MSKSWDQRSARSSFADISLWSETPFCPRERVSNRLWEQGSACPAGEWK
jgi:hypothetical protein